MERFFIKKFAVLIFFLLLFMPLKVCAEYISSDDTFTFNLWFTTDEESPVRTSEFISLISGDVASESLLVMTYGQLQPGSDTYFINIYSGSGGQVFYYLYIPAGTHMLTINYNGNAYYPVSLYLDGIGKQPYAENGRVMSHSVSGDVFLGENVISGSFTYSSDILSSSQITSLFSDGPPTIVDQFYDNVSVSGLDTDLLSLLVALVVVGSVFAGYAVIKKGIL